MMNILLVEDEPPILRGLQNHIKRYRENFEIRGAFTNARDALQYLMIHFKSTDVVITDIELPLINGLSFIQQINEQFPHITCIIISGYDNFEYAQTAIRLGVSNYLTKPVNTEELHKTLLNIYEKKCMDSISKPPLPEKEYEAALSFSDEYSLAIICDGNESYFNPMPHSDIYNYEYQSCNYYSLLNTSSDIAFKMVQGRSSYESILFMRNNYANKTCLSNISCFFSPLLQQPGNFTIVYSKVPANLSDIRQYMQNMRYFLYKSLIFGQSQLLQYFPQRWEEPPSDSDVLKEKLYQLQRFFENGDIQLFKQDLRTFLLHMKKEECRQLTVFHYLNLLASGCLTKFRQDKSGLSIPEMINDSIFYSSDYEALFENLLSVFMDEFTGDNQPKGNLLENIDCYIKQHYMEPMNTRQLAEAFHFTPSYLSKIFREYKNISPIEYIIQLKIEKAKNLFISNPSLPVKECASLIGYHDPLYFSKVFKKVTGMSPKQFISSSIT